MLRLETVSVDVETAGGATSVADHEAGTGVVNKT